MDVHFFGPSDQRQLLGVAYPPRLHEALGDGPVKSVLICPPLGQEYVRSYWALGLIARQLARKGVHVMRFDYRGHGDSFGCTEDVKTLSHWKEDIGSAIDQLKRRSGAETVMLAGLRAGAGLATEVASERDDVNSIVAWEPVASGASYLASLRRMHALMLDLWYQPTETPNDSVCEELLGMRYDRTLIDELERWQVDMAATLVPQLIIERSDDSSVAEDSLRPWQRRLATDDPSSWNKLIDLEAAWLRPQASQKVVNAIVDMFDRLCQQDMLRPVRECCNADGRGALEELTATEEKKGAIQ